MGPPGRRQRPTRRLTKSEPCFTTRRRLRRSSSSEEGRARWHHHHDGEGGGSPWCVSFSQKSPPPFFVVCPLLLKIILEERRLLKTLNPASKKMRFDETFCPLSFFTHAFWDHAPFCQGTVFPVKFEEEVFRFFTAELPLVLVAEHSQGAPGLETRLVRQCFGPPVFISTKYGFTFTASRGPLLVVSQPFVPDRRYRKECFHSTVEEGRVPVTFAHVPRPVL